MEWMRLCQKAFSPWASSLDMVKKLGGSWRPCGDYRRLNLQNASNRYKVFSKLDLLKRVLPGSRTSRWCPHDCHRHTVWHVCFQLLHLWSEEQRRHLPTDDGPDIRQPSLLSHLRRRHPHLRFLHPEGTTTGVKVQYLWPTTSSPPLSPPLRRDIRRDPNRPSSTHRRIFQNHWCVVFTTTNLRNSGVQLRNPVLTGRTESSCWSPFTNSNQWGPTRNRLQCCRWWQMTPTYLPTLPNYRPSVFWRPRSNVTMQRRIDNSDNVG